MSAPMTIADATLYDLTTLRLRIKSALEESEGVLDDRLAVVLDAWEAAFPEKVQNIVQLVHDLEGDAVKLKAEEDRLKAKRAAFVSRAEWFTGYLARNMEALDLDEAGGPLGSAKFVKNPPKVEPVVHIDEADLRNLYMIVGPEFVKREPETYALNKDAIKAAAKRGDLPEDLAKRVRITQGRRLELK